MSEESDEALIEQLRTGEPSALAALYDRHAPTMFALARRILDDEREAQDLLHDVFIEAWQRAREFEPTRGRVRTWLLVRVRSRALDRKASARLSKRAPAPSDDLAERTQVSNAAERIAVRAALEQLPVEVRQAIELSYFAGMTAGEIAARAGTPEGTIRSRLARGLRLLEELLGEDQGPR